MSEVKILRFFVSELNGGWLADLYPLPMMNQFEAIYLSNSGGRSEDETVGIRHWERIPSHEVRTNRRCQRNPRKVAVEKGLDGIVLFSSIIYIYILKNLHRNCSMYFWGQCLWKEKATSHFGMPQFSEEITFARRIETQIDIPKNGP